MSKLTLQEQFNLEHQEPVPYGEDGDIYGLSSEFDGVEAINKFEKYWEETAGEDEPKPDLSVGIGSFRKSADGWTLEFGDGDVEGTVLQIS